MHKNKPKNNTLYMYMYVSYSCIETVTIHDNNTFIMYKCTLLSLQYIMYNVQCTCTLHMYYLSQLNILLLQFASFSRTPFPSFVSRAMLSLHLLLFLHELHDAEPDLTDQHNAYK